MVPPVPVLLKLLTVAPTLRVVALTAPVNDPVPVTFCRVRALTPETDVPLMSLPSRTRLNVAPVTAPTVTLPVPLLSLASRVVPLPRVTAPSPMALSVVAIVPFRVTKPPTEVVLMPPEKV